ncbi:hypothetical protein [Serratia sp. 3ACOL1]|uniref:hypothetical protein n=1 Tax=Serratia sp. 3ACOL1 TaxID=2448483 RepID=UPI00138FE406|nr:hypothetical protein [Serratia sp. 3ACOL1]
MKKFKYITLSSMLLVFGCNGKYIDNRQIGHLVDMSTNECSTRELKNCERYHSCMMSNYDKIRKDHSGVAIAISYILFYTPIQYQENHFSHLMDNAYSLLTPDSRYADDPTVTVGVSYFIYAHNACASITGDKTYNIDSYMPLLREKLGVK